MFYLGFIAVRRLVHEQGYAPYAPNSHSDIMQLWIIYLCAVTQTRNVVIA